MFYLPIGNALMPGNTSTSEGGSAFIYLQPLRADVTLSQHIETPETPPEVCLITPEGQLLLFDGGVPVSVVLGIL